jgi:hypothetical protein
MQAANQQNAALELRLAQAAERNRPEDEEIEAEQPNMSLRQRRQMAKRQDEKAKALEMKKVEAGDGFLRIKRGKGLEAVTAGFLRAAWMSEGTIVGFLLGLAYINLHVFLRLVLGPRMFCRLGDEWVTVKLGDQVISNNPTFWAEAIQLIFFDLLLFGAIAFFCFWLYLFAQLITEPWEFATKNGLTLFKALWDMIRTKLTS